MANTLNDLKQGSMRLTLLKANGRRCGWNGFDYVSSRMDHIALRCYRSRQACHSCKKDSKRTYRPWQWQGKFTVIELKEVS